MKKFRKKYTIEKNPKTEVIQIRVTPNEKKAISIKASSVLLTKSEYLRQLAMSNEIKSYPQSDFFEHINCISIIADALKESNDYYARKCASDIDTFLEKIKEDVL